MRALSIVQPWCWLIIHGGKDVENRVWTTKIRGEFLIHASKGMTEDDYDGAWETARSISQDLAWRIPPKDKLERGGIVGVAQLYDVLSITSRPQVPWHMPDQYGFRLRNARPLPFLPCKGSRGWWGNFRVSDGKAVQL